MHFRAETAANVRRHNPQLMFGNADGVGDPPAMHVRHLALKVNGQRAVNIRLGQNGARFHAGRDQPVVGKAKTDDMISRLHGLLVVAATDLVDRGDVVRHVVVELRRAVTDRRFFIDNRGKRFVVDVDKSDGIVGPGLALGHHQRDAFADKAHPVDGDDGPVRHLRSRHDPVGYNRADLAGKVGAG